jgi:hypothetical protein
MRSVRRRAAASRNRRTPSFRFAAAHARTGISAAGTGAIAKAAHIYGFPFVDRYRVQYDYFVDDPGVQGALEPYRQHAAGLHAG